MVKRILIGLMLLLATNPAEAIVPVNGGGTGATTAQTAINNLFNTPATPISPVMVQCDGAGDEQAFISATSAASTRKAAILVGAGCQPANQWIPGAYTGLYNLAGATTDINTMGSVEPRISYFSSGIAANAPGAAAIDLHGDRTFSAINVNFMGQDIAVPATIFENSVQNGACCASNALQLGPNVSVGNTGAAIGSPLDGNWNPIKVNGVFTGTLTSGGTGYVDGTYYKVPLTGGSGTGAFANIITVSGGVVTVVNLGGAGNEYWKYPGTNYAVNDVLSASNADLGGAGSGFQLTVNTLTKATSTAANTLVRGDKVQFANIGTCGLCLNTSDIFMRNFEATGIPGVFIMPVFGGGGNDIGNGRMEFLEKGIWFGGPNSSTINGGTLIHDIAWDFVGQNYDSPSRSGVARDAIEIDSSSGFNLNNMVFYRSQSTDAPIKLGGTGANTPLANIILNNINMFKLFSASSQTACVEVNNGGNGAAPDNIILDNINCQTTTDAPAVKLNAIPIHYFENSFSSGHVTDATFTGKMQWWDRFGRPMGISDLGSTHQPDGNATWDLSGSTKGMANASGTTAQRPASPLVGEQRYNTDNTGLEVFYGSAWNPVRANAVEHISYQPGLLTALNSTKTAFHKFSGAGTVNNIEGSANTFSCVSNPTVTVFECGTDGSCATPTTIGTVTLTTAGTVVDGTINNAAIGAGHYVAFSETAGTCASSDISVTVQIHAN